MSVTVSEQWGRRLSDKSGDIYYLVAGTDNPATAREAVRGEAPSAVGGLDLDDIEVREVAGTDEPMYTAVARYVKEQSSGGGGSEPELPADQFRFDTTGGSEHVTLALQHIQTYAHPSESGTPANFGGAIGVNGDSAEGVSIVVPKFGFSIVKYLENGDVTSGFISNLYHLTGKTNDSAYSFTVDGKTLSYEADELLFLGVTGAKNLNTGFWELTYNFAGSPNETSLTVGAFTIAKKGWEYVWARMEKREDSAAKQIISKPVALHVERVYKRGDFDDLGL